MHESQETDAATIENSKQFFLNYYFYFLIEG